MVQPSPQMTHLAVMGRQAKVVLSARIRLLRVVLRGLVVAPVQEIGQSQIGLFLSQIANSPAQKLTVDLMLAARQPVAMKVLRVAAVAEKYPPSMFHRTAAMVAACMSGAEARGLEGQAEQRRAAQVVPRLISLQRFGLAVTVAVAEHPMHLALVAMVATALTGAAVAVVAARP